MKAPDGEDAAAEVAASLADALAPREISVCRTDVVPARVVDVPGYGLVLVPWPWPKWTRS